MEGGALRRHSAWGHRERLFCKKSFRYVGGSHIQIARSPRKQGTRELPREFPINYFLNLITF
jgi:hypothetical protein